MARCTTPEYSPEYTDNKRKSNEDLCAAKKLKHDHNDPRHIPIIHYNDNKRAVFISGLHPGETKNDVKQVVEQFGEVVSLRVGNLSWKSYNKLVNTIGKHKISPHYQVVFKTVESAKYFKNNAPSRYKLTFDRDITEVQYDIYLDTVLFGVYKMDEGLQTEIRKLSQTEQVFNLALWIENLRRPRRVSTDYMNVPGVSIDSNYLPKELKISEIQGNNNKTYYDTIAEFATFVGHGVSRDRIKSQKFAIENLVSEIVH